MRTPGSGIRFSGSGFSGSVFRDPWSEMISIGNQVGTRTPDPGKRIPTRLVPSRGWRRRHVGEPGVDGFKRRTGIRRSIHAKRRRFSIDGGIAVARVGMVAQPLRTAAAALALDRAKHIRHLSWVVSGASHDLRAEQIRFTLVLTAVLHKICAKAELRSLSDNLPGSPAHDGPEHLAGDRAELKFLRLCCLQRSMAENDVTQFVRHDTRDLVVGPRRL